MPPSTKPASAAQEQAMGGGKAQQQGARGEVPGGGGGAGGAGDGRPVDAGDDIPGVDAGAHLLRGAHLPQHLLHVPHAAAHHLGHPGPDPRAPRGALHGLRAARPRGQAPRRPPRELQPQPGPVQHQGARHHHHLRQLRSLLRRRRRLLHRRHHRHEGLLQADAQLPLRPPHRPHHADTGLWLGWNAAEVPGGPCRDVVAFKSRPGLTLQGAARDEGGREAVQGPVADALLPHLLLRELRLLRAPRLPAAHPDLLLVGVLGVAAQHHGAAGRVRVPRAGRGRVHAGLGGHLCLPRQPAGGSLGVHRQHGGGLRHVHLRHRAALLLAVQHLRRPPLPHLLQPALHLHGPEVRHHQGAHQGLRPQRGRLRQLRQAVPQPALRHLHRLRVPPLLGHHRARAALPRRRDVEAEQVGGRQRGQAGRARQAHAEVQAGAAVVVPAAARRQRGRVAAHVLRVEGGGAAALVGDALRLRARLRRHPPHRRHPGHHQPATRVRHHRAVHDRLRAARQAHRQPALQDLRPDQHRARALLPRRPQARPLHEDPSALHVHRAAGGHGGGRRGEPGRGVVDAGQHREHLRRGGAPPGEPLDVPKVPCHLRRVGDLGPHRAGAALRPARAVPEPGVALHRGRRAARAGVAAQQGVPGEEVDRAHQRARHLLRVRRDAAGHAHQHRQLARHRHHLQLLRLQVPQGVVAEVQLRAVRGARRRHGIHGGAHLLRPPERPPRPQVVGHRGRPLPAGHMPHRAGHRRQGLSGLLSARQCHVCS